MPISFYKSFNIICLKEEDITNSLKLLEERGILWKDGDKPTSYRESLKAPITFHVYEESTMSFSKYIDVSIHCFFGDDFAETVRQNKIVSNQETEYWHKYLAYVKAWADENMSPKNIMAKHLSFESWLYEQLARQGLRRM